jgi:hypothetical protein
MSTAASMNRTSLRKTNSVLFSQKAKILCANTNRSLTKTTSSSMGVNSSKTRSNNMSGLKVLACIVKANSEIKGIPAAISFCGFWQKTFFVANWQLAMGRVEVLYCQKTLLCQRIASAEPKRC